MRNNMYPVWVRKLIGKPAFLTIADCESEARRIQLIERSYGVGLSLPAAESNAFRIQSGFACPELRIAALICFASGAATRTANNSPLASPFGSFGLPIFFFILLLTKCLT